MDHTDAGCGWVAALGPAVGRRVCRAQRAAGRLWIGIDLPRIGGHDAAVVVVQRAANGALLALGALRSSHPGSGGAARIGYPDWAARWGGGPVDHTDPGGGAVRRRLRPVGVVG